MSKYVEYTHHEEKVFVREDLKGKHRQYCLCFSCSRFHPGDTNNCPVANRVYKTCVDCDLVTPVWECPMFLEK
jgi:RNA polymerase subunit RPABC4/transcription elongation factor Spt4